MFSSTAAMGGAAISMTCAGINSFISDNQGHCRRRNGINPPPFEQVIEDQTNKKDSSQVSAEVSLLGISIHGRAVETRSDFAFGA
jgi:hypothetical protein